MDETDQIEALDAGADDYLTKPFGLGELLARVRAAMRQGARIVGGTNAMFRFGDVEVEFTARVVRKGDKTVHLTPIERLME